MESTLPSPRGDILYLVLDVSPPSVPRRPKPGPPSWEGLIDREFRVRRMMYLIIKGYSFRAIAKDLGVARTTVARMKPDVAKSSAYTRARPRR